MRGREKTIDEKLKRVKAVLLRIAQSQCSLAEATSGESLTNTIYRRYKAECVALGLSLESAPIFADGKPLLQRAWV